MLRLRCSTAVVVLAWASALHAADPLPLEPAPAPAPGAPGAPGDSAAFPPIDPLPVPPPESQATPPAPGALEPVKEEKPSPPDRVSVGKNGGFFQPGVYLQFWGQVTKADTQKTTTGFRLRRAEVRAKGEILPKLLSWAVVFDLTKTPGFTTTTAQVPVTAADGGASPGTVAVPTSTLGADRSLLQDAYFTYISEYADVTVGQFKIPVSLEALQPLPRLFFPDRSRVTREYGDRRDVGIRIDKKIADVFYYNVGVFNGNGQNVVDNDRAKDLALRLEAYPIPGLTIGGVAYGTVGAEDVDTVRNRVEGDLRLEIADLIVQGEYIHGWTGPKARRLEGHGAYGAVGYMIAEQFQPVARIGLVDINLGDDIAPRTEPESGPQRQFELGLNYLVKGWDAKLTAAISHYAQEHGLDTTEFTLQSQATF
ncbi:MAG: porin [Deltaproteobacteria bacterium]